MIFSWPRAHTPSLRSFFFYLFPTQSQVLPSSFSCAVTGSSLLLFSQRLLGSVLYSTQVSIMLMSRLQLDLGAQNSASLYKAHMSSPNTAPHPWKRIRRSSPLKGIQSFLHMLNLQDSREVRNMDSTRSGFTQACPGQLHALVPDVSGTGKISSRGLSG